MIELKRVTKRFGSKVAVQDLTLTVPKGEILGLLGPNGAGKTTTMRIITGYLPPTAGEVRVAGVSVAEDPVAVKKLIGYLPETPPLYKELTVREQLHFVARSKGIGSSQRKKEVEAVMEQTDTAQVGGRLIANLSYGYRRRVGLAQALLGNPSILILDEPTAGLDPRQVSEIRQLIRRFAGERTVILSSHILPEVSQLCQRVAIMNRGALVAEDTPASLAQGLNRSQRLVAEIKGPPQEVAAGLKNIEGVERVEAGGQTGAESGRYTLLLSPRADSLAVKEQLFFVLARAGWPLLELTTHQASLEEVFLQLVLEEQAVGEGA